MNNSNSDTSHDEHARVAVLRYAQLLQKQGVEQRDAWIPLCIVSDDIAEGTMTEAVQSLIALYEAINPGSTNFDETARDKLFTELRVAATFFQKGYMCYPTIQEAEDKTISAKQDESRHLIQTVVCSDVHLGVKQAKRDAFFNWLDKWRDTSIILLGDILDLWIYSDKLDDDALIEHVAAEWQDLWKHLSNARDRGCNIHFVPGNHDAFVYFIESADHDQWSNAVLERTPLLRGIRERTRHTRLLEIADLHYPYFRLRTETSTILLTHGHYATWGWRLIAGLEDAPLKLHPALASASVVLAHKNARLLRRINNEWDWLRRTHKIEDTAISITNAVLSSYQGARQLGEHDVVALVDRATAMYFGATTDASSSEELKIREAFLYMNQNQDTDKTDLMSVRDRNINFLRQAQSGANVDLSRRNGSAVIAHTALSDYAECDTFVFGHFHSPRDEEGVHDTGGFVDSIETFLKIYDGGRISR